MYSQFKLLNFIMCVTHTKKASPVQCTMVKKLCCSIACSPTNFNFLRLNAQKNYRVTTIYFLYIYFYFADQLTSTSNFYTLISHFSIKNSMTTFLIWEIKTTSPHSPHIMVFILVNAKAMVGS